MSMSKPMTAYTIAAIILTSMAAGCLGNVPDEVESESIEQQNQITSLNNTITNLSLENEAKSASINELKEEIQLLELHNQILDQEVRLQGLEFNQSIQILEDEIQDIENELAIANALIVENLTSEGGLDTASSSPLLYESYNSSEEYMNHANWNGGLWDRVIFDDEGIPLVQYSHGLEYVPTTAFHWGLVSISKWLVGGEVSHFENATEIASWAVENQSENGGWGWYFDHSFHGGVLGDMTSGWYGAMTQGLGMSFLARMYSATSNESYRESAIKAMELFSVNVEQGGVLRTYNGLPWYEEYPTPDAGSFVLNGYIYALIGLYDLYEVFNSSEALELYYNGTGSLYSMIGLFDLGCSSSYDLVHHSVPGTAPNIAREGYHNLHVTLLSVLNVIENGGFQSIEDRWAGYAGDVCFKSPNGAN